MCKFVQPSLPRYPPSLLLPFCPPPSAQARAAAQLPGRPISFTHEDATALPFPAGSFDCVLDTFSLCVITQPAAAVAEMARLLRPGGRALLLEHTRSDNPLLGAYQVCAV